MTMAVFKTPFMILHACTFLAASTATSGINGGSMTSEDSETARHLTVPIRTSMITIQYDPDALSPMALLSYDNADIPTSELLFIKADILPVVNHVTGCAVITDPITDTQLLSADALNGIPLTC